MFGEALYVTIVPEQTGLTDGEIVILTGKIGLTIIVTVLDVAGFPLAQGALEVSLQVTRSPLRGIYENEVELVPAMTPFTFH